MWNLYHIIRLITTPLNKLGKIFQEYASAVAYLPSVAVMIIMAVAYFRVQYHSVGGALGYAVLYLIVGSIVVSILNFISSAVVLAVDGVAIVCCGAYNWAKAKEDTTPNKETIKAEKKKEKEREEQEAFYRAMTEERDYTMCYDPGKTV